MRLGNRNEKTVYGFVAMVYAYLYVRMTSYLDPGVFNGYAIIYASGIIVVYTGLTLLTIRRVPMDGTVVMATLFWLMSVISNVFHDRFSVDLIMNVLTQSWWYFIYLFFLLLLPTTSQMLQNKLCQLSTIFFFIYMIRYAVWFFSPTRYWSSGSVNSVYYGLMLLPFIHIVKRKWVRLVMLLLAGVIAIVSGKRAALIVVCVVAFLPVMFRVSDGSTKRLSSVFIGLLTVIGLYFAISMLSEYIDITIFDRFASMEEDGGSGRLTTYENVWKAFIESDILSMLFGHGYNGVVRNGVSGSSAHNDFLEVLYNYGACGFVLYAGFIFSLVTKAKKLYCNNDVLFPAVVAALGTFLVMSCVSHLIIYPTYIIFLLLIFALSCRTRTVYR